MRRSRVAFLLLLLLNLAYLWQLLHQRAPFSPSHPPPPVPTLRPRAPQSRVLLVALTHSSNHALAAAANATWGRACHTFHAADVAGPWWFSNAANSTPPQPHFSPTVVASASGDETRGGVTGRIVAMLRAVIATPGAVEEFAWVVRAWDDSWVSCDALAALAQQYDADAPLAVGMLGTFTPPELPFIMWGGCLMLLSRGTMRLLRDGGLEWCWATQLAHRGEAQTAEDVYMSKCLQMMGVRFTFGDGLYQGSADSLGFVPLHPQWAACGRRVLIGSRSDGGGEGVALEGDPSGGGLSGHLPVSFHYMSPANMRELYVAKYETNCTEGTQEEIDGAAGGWAWWAGRRPWRGARTGAPRR